MKSGIYTITNIKNGKIYVGCTNNIPQRIWNHKKDLRKNIHKNIHLQRAWIEYGEQSFSFEALEYWEEEYLYVMEHYWCTMIGAHDPKYGYNIRPTHPIKYYTMSTDLRNKISESNRTRIISKETREKMSKSRKGVKLSNVTKERMSKSRVGMKFSESRKEKLRKPNKHNVIIQVTKDGYIVKTHNSMTDAAKYVNGKVGNIWQAFDKNNKTAYGFIWKSKNQ